MPTKSQTLSFKWEVLSKAEGDCWLSPYIPLTGKHRPYIGNEAVTKELIRLIDRNSGVTVATGFDLGGREVSALERMGFPKGIVGKLGRFCKKTRGDAMIELHKAVHEGDDPYSIDLTESEAALCCALVERHMVGTIQRDYDQAVRGRPGKKTFAELDERVRTAIICFAWQYGENLHTYLLSHEPRKTFARTIFEQHWAECAFHLKSIRNDKLRRAVEASLFFDFVEEDSYRSDPTTPEGGALKSIRRHARAAETLPKKGGGGPVW